LFSISLKASRVLVFEVEVVLSRRAPLTVEEDVEGCCFAEVAIVQGKGWDASKAKPLNESDESITQNLYETNRKKPKASETSVSALLSQERPASVPRVLVYAVLCWDSNNLIERREKACDGLLSVSRRLSFVAAAREPLMWKGW
jgi:hypothetical protein